MTTRARPSKRPTSAPQTASVHDKDIANDYLCPVCFDVIDEAHITKCGHTFCYRCVMQAIQMHRRCPKCNMPISTEHLVPNFLLNELVTKYRNRLRIVEGKPTDTFKEFVAESEQLTLTDVNEMLEQLRRRKERLEAESTATENRLVRDFLRQLLRLKEQQLQEVTTEVEIVKSDLGAVEATLNAGTVEAVVPDQKQCKASDPSNSNPESSFSLRSTLVQSHFDDFVKCYFACRATEVTLGTTSGDNLDSFRDSLAKFSRYTKLQPIATLSYSTDVFNNSTIVSSIEFDKDNEFFAIAGVTKRIKVYEYGTVVRDIVDVHYPCTEMVSTSKISCISWNSYHKGILASSDYEGTVSIWDVLTGQRTKTFQEHEKRCWSVDFNNMDTRLIASGSDDARVKLWSLNMDRAVATLEAKANVCCVQFNPRSSTHLAFGSADHCVHYYDLRHTKHSLMTFKGHRKAVSYVKFASQEEIVSASTDSQLKLWTATASHCVRSYVGHQNEKNFVGLATDGDYIACGSETNSLYIYYKGLSKQLMYYKFDGTNPVFEFDDRDDVNEFVSAVCWKQKSNVVLAANSKGIIKILELV